MAKQNRSSRPPHSGVRGFALVLCQGDQRRGLSEALGGAEVNHQSGPAPVGGKSSQRQDLLRYGPWLLFLCAFSQGGATSSALAYSEGRHLHQRRKRPPSSAQESASYKRSQTLHQLVPEQRRPGRLFEGFG